MKSSPLAWLPGLLFAAFVACGASAATLRVAVEIPNALGVEFGSPPQRAVRLELFLEPKEIETVLVLPTARNPALAGWDARDIVSKLAWKSGELEGVVTATIVPAGPGDSSPWKCVIHAAWKEGALAGRADCFMENTSMAGTEFLVKPAKLAESRGGDGFVELILPGSGASPGVRAGVEFRDGKAVNSASFGPLIHPMWQNVDASALELKRGRLSGRIAWSPIAAGDDGVASAPGPLEIKSDLRDGFAVVRRGEAAGVALLGAAPAFPEHAEIELAFDAPLVGGERWRRRVVVRLELSHDRVDATAFLNGRGNPDWSAAIDSISVERKGGQLSGTIDATVASATVQPGFYRIRFTGEAVGSWIAGTYGSELAGTEAATGGFTGWVAPAGR